MKVVGFGDNVVDQYQHTGVMYPGGNAVNFAVYAKQLGIPSAYIGVFGNDVIADHIKDTLTKLEIDLSHCVVKQGESGFCLVNLVEGDRVFVDWNEGGISTKEPMILGETELDYLNQFALIHSGCFAKVETELKKLTPLEALVSFDFADEEPFHQEGYLQEVCPHIDFALFSCKGQSMDSIKTLLQKVIDLGTTYALATMGTDGSVFFDGQAFYEGVVELVEPLDTMGAGDSFVTAFLIHLLQNGWKKNVRVSPNVIEDAFNKAARFSANNCLREGAFGFGRKFE
ncbi:PfkB family carbohydrate kinase [Bacillus sp. JJ1764]|uniref:PfkB family carbohydrate kinase n=1 Tax=Bacillus sp. JJ1764 TaxID=3122964 RepID=UPI002FFF2DAD